MASRTQQTVPRVLKREPLAGNHLGLVSISTRSLTPPCLATKRQRWFPSNPRRVTLPSAVSSSRREAASCTDTTTCSTLLDSISSTKEVRQVPNSVTISTRGASWLLLTLLADTLRSWSSFCILCCSLRSTSSVPGSPSLLTVAPRGLLTPGNWEGKLHTRRLKREIPRKEVTSCSWLHWARCLSEDWVWIRAKQSDSRTRTKEHRDDRLLPSPNTLEN